MCLSPEAGQRRVCLCAAEWPPCFLCQPFASVACSIAAVALQETVPLAVDCQEASWRLEGWRPLWDEPLAASFSAIRFTQCWLLLLARRIWHWGAHPNASRGPLHQRGLQLCEMDRLPAGWGSVGSPSQFPIPILHPALAEIWCSVLSCIRSSLLFVE